MKLYPLKFRPILKERLWGGTRLRDVLGKPIESDITGESWELSGVEGDISMVANGPLAGKSLNELISVYKGDLMGNSVYERFGAEFPILIKFIDARMDLSIQLHPDDALARERHNSFGKTEMWYIMDAEEDARLIVGFDGKVNREIYEQSLADDNLTDILHYETVKEGDTFFIDTGTIHAIGAGVLLAEIQQTSDITYRVFDFNRRDKDGNLRELHTELAIDAINFQGENDFKVAYGQKADTINKMVHSPYFKTDYLELTRDLKRNLSSRDSFTILMCVSGNAVVHSDTGAVVIQKGETLLVPACSTYLNICTGGVKILEVTL